MNVLAPGWIVVDAQLLEAKLVVGCHLVTCLGGLVCVFLHQVERLEEARYVADLFAESCCVRKVSCSLVLGQVVLEAVPSCAGLLDDLDIIIIIIIIRP
jgi:hypothetical protein